MYWIHICLLLTCLCAAFAKEEDVVELVDSDFESRMSDYEVALVMFYAPWCGHCKRLKPEYAKAAEDLLRNDPPVMLVKVDCTEGGKESCTKYGVSGYPTLKVFKNGDVLQDYGGPRDAAGIVKYMKAQVGPSSKELETVADFDKFLTAEKDVSVVGFFEKETDLKIAFMKVADKLREKVRFAHTSFKNILEKQGTKNAIILFRPAYLANKFEDDSVTYSEKADADQIQQFIKENYHGLVGHRTYDNKDDFKNPLIVAYYNVDYNKNAKGTNYWRNRILKVAKNHKEYNFAISNKDQFQMELNEFGVEFTKGDKPLVFAKNDKDQKFVMSGDFSIESFEKFVKDLIAEKLEPYLKSEAIPESNDEPVKIAVAKNFDEVVTNNGKDTLIEFYAPWCGHCKKLTPIYDELAKTLQNEDVAIVKMDATVNDVPQPFDVKGFPTLYWAPKDNKNSPVRYEGGRELNDFIKYIAKHATSELKTYDRKGNEKKKTEL
ncbi:hypothetical protein RN001_016176 [Aquatica leii]|uniref:Protein disulfide-isomerase n=1 Tax=Aquatica leii TaxID=1421715 RepID=A0AAN7NX85_9COLE|nr:hypothetical protein RN001_016176 [Aquatica leii]